MELMMYQGLVMSGTLAPKRPRAGFDRDAQGLVPGEGAVVLLLKRLSDARRDGNTIHGIVRGVGLASGPSIDTASRDAVARARSQCASTCDQVGFVEATGLGIAEVDRAEATVLADQYPRREQRTPIWLGSLVAQIGHTGAASGLASLLKATLALEHERLPATPLFEHPAEYLEPLATSIEPAEHLVGLRTTGAASLLGAVNCIDHGLAGHVIVEQPLAVAAATRPTAAQPAVPQPAVRSAAAQPTVAKIAPRVASPAARPLLVRLGAATAEELIAACNRWALDAPRQFAEAAFLRFRPEQRVRLTLIAASADELRHKMNLVASRSPILGRRSFRCCWQPYS
jgi:acyl transferase domain-containing protein